MLSFEGAGVRASASTQGDESITRGNQTIITCGCRTQARPTAPKWICKLSAQNSPPSSHAPGRTQALGPPRTGSHRNCHYHGQDNVHPFPQAGEAAGPGPQLPGFLNPLRHGGNSPMSSIQGTIQTAYHCREKQTPLEENKRACVPAEPQCPPPSWEVPPHLLYPSDLPQPGTDLQVGT